jgi:hypothetical protein
MKPAIFPKSHVITNDNGSENQLDGEGRDHHSWREAVKRSLVLLSCHKSVEK